MNEGLLGVRSFVYLFLEIMEFIDGCEIGLMDDFIWNIEFFNCVYRGLKGENRN